MRNPITHKENFNQNVLVIVCLAGLLRVVIEMYQNTPKSGVLDFYLDLAYGVIFIVTLIALWKKASYQVVFFSFFVPLIVLLCLTLYDRKGVASSTENNIYIGIIIIALTMRSSDARRFSVYLILGTVLSLLFVEIVYGFLTDFTDYSTSSFNFIFMTVGVIFVIYYSKRMFEHRKMKLYQIRKELSENHRILEQSRSELETQTLELETLNKELEAKVNERLAILNDQKEAMKEYLDLTSKKLQKEHEGIYELTQSIVGASHEEISKMMLDSSKKLDLEIKSLVSKLEEER